MGGRDPDGAEIGGRGPIIELLFDTGVGGFAAIENGFGMDAHALMDCEGMPRPIKSPGGPMDWCIDMPCGIIPVKSLKI